MVGVVEAYVDGACDPNPGRGGYGIVLRCDGHEKEIWGPREHTDSFDQQTNNRMEIIAAVEALRALKRRCEVRLYSDSAYLVNTMNGKYRKGTNLDLWRELAEEAVKHAVEWIKLPRKHKKLLRPHEFANRGLRE